MSALIKVERNRLTECEATIERGLSTFVEVGSALLEIRDSRLYRETHATFEEYCRERWGMSRQRANQLVGAASVVENLTTMVAKPETDEPRIESPPPISERQARPLVGLPAAQQQQAWQKAVESAPNGKPTGKQVERAVVEVAPKRTKVVSPPVILASDDDDSEEEEADDQFGLGRSYSPPKEAPTIGEGWHQFVRHFSFFRNALDRKGGIRKLTIGWKPPQIKEQLVNVNQAIDLFQSIRSDLEEVLRGNAKSR